MNYHSRIFNLSRLLALFSLLIGISFSLVSCGDSEDVNIEVEKVPTTGLPDDTVKESVVIDSTVIEVDTGSGSSASPSSGATPGTGSSGTKRAGSSSATSGSSGGTANSSGTGQVSSGSGSSSSGAGLSGRTGNETGGDGTYSTEAFTSLLGPNVSSGRVKYAAFKGNSSFADLLAGIANAAPDAMGTDERLAFWINAYNALVIKNVLDHPGTKNPLDVNGFFDKITFRAGGRTVTLNDIENKIVRPTFREPLIHFGLVCAARSCPPLINRAYTAANVRTELANNARRYLADTRQNSVDQSKGELQLSEIFKWYAEDFGGGEKGLRSFVQSYGTEDMKQAIASNPSIPITYKTYDWTLNGE